MSTARKILTVEQAPPEFELTKEDVRAIAEAKERVRQGVPGVPHSEVMRMLEERRRVEKK